MLHNMIMLGHLLDLMAYMVNTFSFCQFDDMKRFPVNFYSPKQDGNLMQAYVPK